LEKLDEKQIQTVMREFNAIGVRPAVDEEEQERKRKNRMTNQKRSQVLPFFVQSGIFYVIS
jgi:hypothetical protein